MHSFIPDYKHTIRHAVHYILNNFGNPLRFAAKVLSRYPLNTLIPDKPYLRFMFKAYTGLSLNFSNPRSFNEKMQWLKVYDRKNWYSNLADKLTVRNYVSAQIGERYLVPLISVYNTAEEIEWIKLPSQFVLKCTHDSGSTIICTDKNKLNVREATAFLRKRLFTNYYYIHREYCYKNITPRIVCEEFLSSNGDATPTDYKFLCFHGVPKLIQADTNRFTDHARFTLLPDWTKAPFDLNKHYVKEGKYLEKPDNLNEMLDIATKLSQGFKFIRIDLYSVKNKVYFSELTFYHGSGYEPIPDKFNVWMGDLLNLQQEENQVEMHAVQEHLMS